MTFATLLLGCAASFAADPGLKRFTRVEPHMGTRFKIIVYAADESTGDGAIRAAFARIAELDGIMTDYRPTSELMRLCHKAGGEPVPVSADLFEVLSRAQEVARRSDGAFDVTVGPLVRLWRRARRTGRLPDPDQLLQARTLVGYDKVRLDQKRRAVQLLKPGMLLDLGGIGKGFAADKALEVLRKHGIDRALVAAGGDIAVSGPPPNTDGWTVGIAPLEDPESKPKRSLVLQHAAVSTSGDAEQHVEIDGKRYSHIVDPRTGIGLVGRMSVTVVAPNGTTADSLTKVVAVLGPERGFPIIDATPGAAALSIRLRDLGPKVEESRRFSKLRRPGATK
jgi:thiamine biosynthesis lipoprotein